jgi:hypothetical protein
VNSYWDSEDKGILKRAFAVRGGHIQGRGGKRRKLRR